MPTKFEIPPLPPGDTEEEKKENRGGFRPGAGRKKKEAPPPEPPSEEAKEFAYISTGYMFLTIAKALRGNTELTEEDKELEKMIPKVSVMWAKRRLKFMEQYSEDIALICTMGAYVVKAPQVKKIMLNVFRQKEKKTEEEKQPDLKAA